MNLRVNQLHTHHHTSPKPHVEKSTIRAAKMVAAAVLVLACRKASLEGGGGGDGDGDGGVVEAFDGVAVMAIFWPASQWYGVLHMK